MHIARFHLAPHNGYLSLIIAIALTACGGAEDSPAPTDAPPIEPDPAPHVITAPPSNHISHAYFRDRDGSAGQVAGTIQVEAGSIHPDDPARAESVWVYWADAQGNTTDDAWLKTEISVINTIVIPQGTQVPENTRALKIFLANREGRADQGSLVLFHDFIGNAELQGPGGNELQQWYYGDNRPPIPIQRTNSQGGLCIFDNGLVSVMDMNNTRDEGWEAGSHDGLANTASDHAYPPYQFLCDNNPVNTYRAITDEVGVWTYSTLNDSMFYGTIVYDTFLKYLGEPPLDEKIRLRVHYGNLTDTHVYWDGAYANFSDGYLFQYSMAPLDAIAHEVGHGVLSRISALNSFEQELSADARTAHEAFGDLSGVMAKYEWTGHSNNWVHGEEAAGLTRRLDQIKTEGSAIASLLDYDDAGDNFYLRIGMLTYPFYLLTNQWGIETAYKVYLEAAKNCWTATMTLTTAAECIQQQAVLAGLSEQDVITAFKTVKIKLFEQGVLAHFDADAYKLRIEFTDDSRSTGDVTQWLWQFGDGQTSTAAHPEHIYSEPGEYDVSLTVTDSSNDQDSFHLRVSVTDQYCAILDSFNIDNMISSVSIGATQINYQSHEWDYTQNPIEVHDPANVAIDIQGDNDNTARSTTWRIWIDLNNNGLYGDDEEELVTDIWVPQGQPYALSTHLDLSELANDGEAKHMRIIGGYHSIISPCVSGVGEALDIRLRW